MKMTIIVLPNLYSIYKFRNDAVLPKWIFTSEFYSITKTKEELSIITVQKDFLSTDILVSKDWRILKIEGPLDFSLTGIIADISAVFKKHEISIFTISTYETDYIMVKQKDLDIGLDALQVNGHKVTFED
jgi:uncharacterized protein